MFGLVCLEKIVRNLQLPSKLLSWIFAAGAAEVMNVKFGKFYLNYGLLKYHVLWVTYVRGEVALSTAVRGGFELSSSTHCTECYKRHFFADSNISQRKKILVLTLKT